MARRSLLIGVSEYGEGFDPLPGSLRDVRGMAAALGDPQQGAFESPLVLENPDLSRMMAEIERFLGGAGKDDLLLLYFSGHGDLGKSVARQQLHLCAAGTRKHQRRLVESSAMSADFLKRQMDDCKSRQIVVILDCCYSGAIADLLRKGEGRSALEELKAEGRVILASSSADQPSYQAVDGLSSYTRYLLEGMAGAALPEQDGREVGERSEWIVARDLHAYAVKKLEVEQKGGVSPKIIVARDEGYEVPIVRAPKADPLFEYGQAVDKLFRELDQDLGLAFDGTVSDRLDRGSLETLRRRLRLEEEAAQQAERKIQLPYLVRAKQRQEYWQFFEDAVEDGFLPSERSQRRLEEIRQNILLGKEDANRIEQEILQRRQPKPRPVAAPVSQQPTPRSSSQTNFSSLFEPQPTQQPMPEAVVRPMQGQTATVSPPLQLPAERVRQKSMVSRRALLRFLGLGGGGIGIVGVWQGLTSRSSESLPGGEKTPGASKTLGVWAEELGKGIKLEMVRIPAGEFLMGSPQDEAERREYEGPQHPVQVPEFFLGKYAVTQAQWKQVAALPKVQQDLNPYPANFKGANRPVEQVSWDAAQEFCARLSKASNKTYRLPSEAEWEYACRAGTTAPFHFGETISTEQVNYDGNYTYGKGVRGKYRKQSTEVGSFPANVFGLHDMHGNVWEWCEDGWHESYEGAPQDGSAWKGSKKSDELYRPLRGGSWYRDPGRCRSAFRYCYRRGGSDGNFGFRVACRVSPRT